MARGDSQAVFEALEARILYSADLAPAAALESALHDTAHDDTEQQRSELVFIDAGLDDVDTLIDDFARQADEGRAIEVILLDPTDDGVTQISEALAGREQIGAIHLITHGEAGGIALGNTTLEAQTLFSRSAEVAEWGRALTADADLLIYGCEVAGTDEGVRFVRDLALLTGADVAASDDLTGARALGGDWQLEHRSGAIETTAAIGESARQQWHGVLAVAVDNSSVGSTADQASITISHATAGSNRLMLVGISMQPEGQSVSSVTYNGASLTRVVAEENSAHKSRAEVWQLLAPATGTHNVVVTLTGSGHKGVVAGVMTYSGVNQAAPTLAVSVASGDSTDATTTVASATDDLVFGVVSSHKGSAVGPGAGQTEHWDFSVNNVNGGGTTEAGAASVTTSWTVKNDKWSVAAVAVQADTNNAQVASLSAVQDAYIQAKNPTTNAGTAASMVIDRETNDLQRALVSFDLGSIPTGSTVVSASLELTASDVKGALSVDVYQLLQSWSEGSVTWNDRSSGTAWSSAGGAFTASAIDSIAASGAGTLHWDITTLAQNWVSGSAQNYGVLVGSPDGGGDRTATFDTREGAVAPRLRLIYQTAVNAAPVNVMPSSQYVTYNTPRIFSAGNGNQISISDADAGGNPVEVTLSVGQGTLSLATTSGLSFSSGADGSGTMTFTGTVSAINTALNGMSYASTANYRGLDTLQIVTNDQGNSGTGGAKNDSDSVKLYVGALVVTNTSDLTNGTTTSIDALVANDGGDGISLREAILTANNTAGTDYVYFDIAGAGVHTINVTGSALPTITGAVLIDGWSEPDFAGTPVIELNGTGAGVGVHGLTISTGSGSTVRGLVINRFGGDGLNVDADNVTIVGNYIGTDATGTVSLGNVDDGIDYDGNNAIIGGTTDAERNVISGNADDGINFGPTASGGSVRGNYIGTDASGMLDLGNSGDGILINGNTITIGGTAAGAGNVISGNDGSGIGIAGESGDDNVVAGNIIGLNQLGTAKVGNTGTGITVNGGADNTVIGGATTAHRNIISGNTGRGVHVGDAGTTGTQVRGNYIGTNLDGSAGLGNGGSGVYVAASFGTPIDGIVIDANVISGNAGYGVYAFNATNLTITGNSVGLDAAGAASLTNADNGIYLGNTSSARVGGTGAGEGNVVNAASGKSTLNVSNSTDTAVYGNRFGTNAAGTVALSGGAFSVNISSSANTLFGGTTAAHANIVAGYGTGVNVTGATSAGTKIQGNFIGTDATGTVDLSNGIYGISLQSSVVGVLVGGTATGAANTVANNSIAGVRVWPSAGANNSILRNLIYANGGLAIDLDALDVTGNDTNDVDPGPNNLQNYPVITQAVVSGGDLSVSGTLDTDGASTQYRIEFFANAAGTQDATHGEGRVYLGATTVTTDAGGDGTFSNVLVPRLGLTSGDYVTATATRIDDPGQVGSDDLAAYGDTSEFARNVLINSAPTLDSTKSPALAAINEDAGAPSGAVGTLISQLVDFASPAGEVDNIADSDAGAQLGIAVTAVDTANGAWWYSVDGGTNWNALGAVSDASARLLGADANTRIAFQPNANYNGTLASAITFRAWDRTSDSNGALADTTVNGASTAFSTATDTASLTITAVNDAPAFANLDGNPTYTEKGAPVVIDADVTISDEELSAADNFDGAWLRLQRNGGPNAQDLFSATGTLSALTHGGSLIVGGTTLGTVTSNTGGFLWLSFNANATNARVNAAMQQIAYANSSEAPPTSAQINWVFSDGNSGAQGSGGSSAAGGSTTVNITAVNDAPTITGLAGDTLGYAEGNGAVVIEQGGDALVSDVDSTDFNGGVLTVAFAAGSDSAEDVLGVRHQGTGAGQIGISGSNVSYAGVTIGSISGGSGGMPLVISFNASATTAAASALVNNVTYTNTDSGAPTTGARTVRYVVTDGDGATSTNFDSTVTVSAVNDAPTLTNGVMVGLAGTDEDSASAGTSVSAIVNNAGWADVDSGAVRGMAVTAWTGNGTWQYSTDAVTWTAFGAVNSSNALLLSATTQIRYVGDGENGEVPTFDFRAWDTTSGSASSNGTPRHADPGAGGGTTAFSSESASASATVTSINDAPVVTTSGGTTAYTEQAPATVIDSALTLVDPDGRDGALSSDQYVGVVTISGNFSAGDTLGFTNTAKIAGNLTGNQLSLSVIGGQSATVADFEAALRSVTFFNGSDTPSTLNRTIGFSFDDGVASSNIGTKVVSVMAVNDAPVLTVNNALSVPEEATRTITAAFLAASDADNAPNQIVYRLTNLPNGGSVRLNGSSLGLNDTFTQDDINNNRVTYRDSDDGKTTTFRFTLSDGVTTTSEFTFSINGQPVNDAPVNTVPASASTNEDTTLAFTGVNQVQISDIDHNGGTLRVRIDVTAGGTLTLGSTSGLSFSTGDGSSDSVMQFTGTLANINAALSTLSFTPTPNFNGSVTFTILTNDQGNTGSGGSLQDSDSFVIAVNAVNDAPTTSPVTLVAIAEDSGARLITQAELLANASDTEGDSLTASALAISAGGGTLIDNGDGTWSYTPAADDDTGVSFSYSIGDGNGGSVAGSASLDITPVNDAPTTSAVVLAPIAEDSGVRLITQAELLANASDTEGDSLTATGLAISAGSGNLVDNGDGTWSYTPATNDGTDVSFSYSIGDGNGGSVAGSASLDITPVNDAPTTSAVVLAPIAEDSGARLITQAELLANASDVEGDGLTATGLAISAGSGNLVDNGNGTWSYTPALDDDTTVSFSYLVTDGVDSTPGSATLDITPINDAAVVSSASVVLIETDAPLSASGTLTATDVDNPDNSFTASTTAGGIGNFAIDASGNWTFTANSAFDSLNVGDSVTETYNVTSVDGTPSTVTIRIDGTNDAAVLSADVANLTETNAASDISTSGTLTISDVDSSPSFVAQTGTAGSYGSFDIDAAGAWTYTASSAHNEFVDGVTYTDTFSVAAADGTTTSVTINILGTNDAAVVSSASVTLIETDAPLSTSGTLTATDVDNADNTFTASSTTGTIGNFAIDAAGAWTFTANSAFDNLNVGDSVSETYNVTSADGTASTVTITIDGTNDAATVSSASVTLIETDAPLSTSGVLTATDVDNADNSFTASNTVGTIGSFSIDAAGTWTFTANSAFDSLNVGDSVTETYNVTSVDGTASSVQITINGTNDAATVSSASVTLIESDAPLSTSGVLTATDVDNADNTFAASSATGTIGSFAIDAAGAWTFTANSAFDTLNVGDSVSETYNVTSADGTPSTVTIQIDGTNDAATVSSASVTLIETDAPLSTSGTLTATDVDNADNTFTASSTTGTIGNFAIDAAGAWTFTANSAFDNLNVGDSVSETYNVTSADGTASTVTITIDGTNDAATVSSASVTLIETDAPPSTSGVLTATDIDNADNSFTASNTVGTIGNFAIDAAGAWTFTANSAFDNLNVGDSVSETYNVTSADGTASTVQITINGTNDAATVSSASVALSETDAPLGTAGTLTSADVDNTDNVFTPGTVTGTIGNFAIDAAGAWTFTANSAFDNLNVGDSVTETYNVTSVDGTASSVQITINGTNDAATVSSASLALAETDAPLSTSGTLTSADVDNADNVFTPGNITGTIGDFAIDAAGVWTFTANSAFDSLNVGDSVTETYNVTSVDGTASMVTITINGTNDAATVSSASVVLIETDAPLSVSGTLTATDVDNPDNSFTASTTAGGIGNFAIDASGNWTFTANSAFDSLNVGDSVTETYNVTSVDGTPSTVTIRIDGTNDAAVLSADVANLTETNAASDISTSGTLTISDVDSSPSFVAQTGTAGSYGSFDIDAAGAWTYTASSAHNEFVDGVTYTDTFSVAAADGTTTSVTINMLGTNDAAVVSSASIALSETDAPLSTGGTLTSADVDNTDNVFTPGTVTGTIGDFAIDAAGAWTFTANSAFDSLNVGDSVSETFNVTSVDGTASTVQMTINGTNDAATVSSASVALAETDAPLSTGGTLTSADVDNADNVFTPGTVTGTIGDFAIDAAGNWTFTANSAFDSLNVGDSVTETFNVASVDGTASSVQITINGTNDAATVSSTSLALAETDVPLSTSGTLTSADVDNADNVFTPGNITGTVGDFAIDAAGNWTFTANSAFDSLNVGDSASETFNVTSVDGTASTVQITINGTNDAATVSSASVALAETDAPLSTGGMLTSADVDNTDNVFTPGTVTGTIGNFAIDAAGAWTFTANSAFDSLNVGDSVTETYNVTSVDGTASAVQITINGINDAATVGSASIALAETDAPLSTGGTLTSADVDNTDNVFTPGTVTGTIGDFAIDASGAWTFTANSAFDSLNVGNSVSETYNVTSVDGTASTVTIRIDGVNDAPVITSAAQVAGENGVRFVSTLSASDVDAGDVLTYSIAGGADAARFVIDAGTGVLRFASVPNAALPADADRNNVYEVIVQVTDRAGASDSQALSVSVALDVAVLPNDPGPEREPEPEAEPEVDAPENPGEAAGTPTANNASSGSAVDANLDDILGAPLPVHDAPEIDQGAGGYKVSIGEVRFTDYAPTSTELLRLLFAHENVSVASSRLDMPDRTVALAAEVLEQIADSGDRAKFVFEQVGVSGVALTVGVVWWATRVGGLVASMMVTLPAWRGIDPLPVLRDVDAPAIGDVDVDADEDTSAKDETDNEMQREGVA